jgi:NAD-dependent deacetylase
MTDEIEKLQQIFDESSRIVFFTGAGVSTESGIPDFRSQDGLYHQQYRYPPEEIISHSFFMHDPEEFYRFYKDRMVYPDARPNPAHRKMAEFEKAGRSLGVVTQNIDGLHEAAGSQHVWQLHGTIYRNHCMKCGREYSLKQVMDQPGVPHCSDCGGIIKPDVVLYEEALDEAVITGAVRAISQADCLVITGTSLVVYPAAGLVNYFSGRHLVLINKSTTAQDRNADLVIQDAVGRVMSQIIVR